MAYLRNTWMLKLKRPKYFRATVKLQSIVLVAMRCYLLRVADSLFVNLHNFDRGYFLRENIARWPAICSDIYLSKYQNESSIYLKLLDLFDEISFNLQSAIGNRNEEFSLHLI